MAGTYPKVWVVKPAGKLPQPLAGFQSAFALIWVEHTQEPTWHNGGDGAESISIALAHQPKKSLWQITLEHGGIKIVQTAPCTGARFGPLVFPGGKQKLARGQSIEFPAIEACVL